MIVHSSLRAKKSRWALQLGWFNHANSHPAPGHLFKDGSTAQGSASEQAEEGRQQLGPTEGGPAYCAVITECTDPQHPIGLHKPLTNSLDNSEPAASPEATIRRLSLGDVRESVWHA